jgi:transcriptional regulator GlxA family with amidase domain
MHAGTMSTAEQRCAVSTIGRSEPARSSGDASQRLAHAVRRAEALIAAHPDAPFTAEVLARAVGVSTRSLSRGFQLLLGQSPMAAVRRARLERVRLDLLAAPSAESVTDAAMRWGFLHLGRFSQQYASQFGELPSTTRRRRLAPKPPIMF